MGNPAPTVAPVLDSSPPQSSPRIRLEDILSRPGALESDEIWNMGLSKIWRNLVQGGRLKKALPLNLVVRAAFALIHFLTAFHTACADRSLLGALDKSPLCGMASRRNLARRRNPYHG